MTDPMNDLILKIQETITKIRYGATKEQRDELEFDINDLNINISGMEYDYDCKYLDLIKSKDDEYKKEKENIKTDAAMKRHLDSNFIDDQLLLDRTEASLKKFKRLHQGFIRVAEHVKSNMIQEQADMKRNTF